MKQLKQENDGLDGEDGAEESSSNEDMKELVVDENVDSLDIGSIQKNSSIKMDMSPSGR